MDLNIVRRLNPGHICNPIFAPFEVPLNSTCMGSTRKVIRESELEAMLMSGIAHTNSRARLLLQIPSL